jgi:hypothetical protein
MDAAADHASLNHYGNWKAPSADGELLIWPAPGDLLADTLANGNRLRSANHVLIQNVPLPEIRRRLREFVGHSDEAAPLLATGHQTELHHPGVWVKNALIDAAAARLGGSALHFAVDTDAPKHLALRWPADDRTPHIEPLTDDPARGSDAWSGRLRPPSPEQLARLSERFEQAAETWGFKPLVPDFLTILRRLSAESVNLSAALAGSMHELDLQLGLRHGVMLVSPICESEAYLAFVHHVLARACDFAADYNAALDDYRRRNKIRTPGRPMPNLRCDPDICEVPFWLDDLSTGARARANVIRTGGQPWTLVATPHIPTPHAPLLNSPRPTFTFDPAADGWKAAAALLEWLKQNNLRLSPRALTLTSVLRLLAADQFVHGIGGGQYDQVADALISRHFGLTPPRFAVTTATLYFPGAAQRSRACVPCVLQEGRRLRHGVLGAEKMKLVEAIAAAPRGSTGRSILFHEMHHKLADAAGHHPSLQRWERKLQDSERHQQAERLLFDRELFYAIQPAERLAGLIERYRTMLG